MTTITFRPSSARQGSLLSGSRVLEQVSSLSSRLADRWQQWKTEREIESMPLDMRKDFGWPSADIRDNGKAMQ